LASTVSAEPFGQRMLAIELRYRIDVARNAENRPIAPVEPHVQAVRELVDKHPQGIKSAHVRHNLGPTRLAWLKERGLINEA